MNIADFLYEAYRGELFGVAFFDAFAKKAKRQDEREKWQTLVELEQRTAELLKAWLEQKGYQCSENDPDMIADGLKTAQPWLALEWGTLMDTMAPWIEGYAVKYRLFAESVKPDDYPVCHMVALHEEAILSFVKAEQLGENNSLQAVRDFILKYRTI